MFSIVFCAASAIAMPPTPSPAMRPVTSRPTFCNRTTTAIAERKTLAARRPIGTSAARRRPPIALEAVGEAVAEEVQQPQRDPGQCDHSQAFEQPAQEDMHRLGERQHRQPRREEQDGEPEQDRPARAAQVIVVGHGVGAVHRRAQQAPRQQGRDRAPERGR